MNSLKNKVALITGSARGLGKAIAERYAALGANIVINYSRDKASAEEVVNNIAAMQGFIPPVVCRNVEPWDGWRRIEHLRHFFFQR